jgi:hypothetical protein
LYSLPKPILPEVDVARMKEQERKASKKVVPEPTYAMTLEDTFASRVEDVNDDQGLR